MSERSGFRRRATIALLALTTAGIALPASASAEPPKYDLQGVWTSGNLDGAVREPANGTQTVTAMNMTTGEFSGHSEVDGIKFTLAGKESGTALEFTQSEGGYESHDTVPVLSIEPSGHIGGNGSFEAGGFWMEVTQPTVAPPRAEESEARQEPFVTVLCNIFPSDPTSSACTADVGDLTGPAGSTPTGTVTFTTTAGTFTDGDTCTLSPAVGLGSVASCTVAFQPAPGTEEGAPLPVSAKYSGDSSLAPATGGTSPVAAAPASSTTEVNNGGFFNVPIVNPNYSAVTGTLTVSSAGAAAAEDTGAHAAASKLASASFSSARFARRSVRLKLSAAGLASLRRHKTLRVLLHVSTKVAGKHVTRSFPLKLKLHGH
jgi:hypothetical protein